MEMHGLGIPYSEIAPHTGHDVKSCMAMYGYLIRITGRPRCKGYIRWSKAQTERLIQIMADHARNRTNVPWYHYAIVLGHSANACRDRAREIRRKRRAEQQSADRAEIRDKADAAVKQRSRSPSIAPPIKPAAPLDHMAATSTARFRFAAEMSARIGAQGITAGLLGDPPPGRSALDQKRREGATP